MLESDAKWIFCNREEAFDLGLVNGEGKIIRGYHTALDAVESQMAKKPQEPFAVMHLSFDADMQNNLAFGGALVGTGHDQAGRRMWTLSRDGANFLFAQGKYQLLMEIIPVERTGICLY